MSSLPALLLQQARERPDAPALREKHRGRWREYSWRDYAERVARAVQPDKPFGIGTLEYQYESDAAGQFEFQKAEL